MPEVSFFVALTAGFLSLLSPCVLALMPVYITYLTGVSVQDQTTRRTTVMANSLLFICGFSLIFILLGASASLLGQLLLRHQRIIRQTAGILVIIMGIHTTGLVQLKFLHQEKRLLFASKGGGINSLFVGMAFAAGWTPCVGPILATILMYAGTTQTLSQGIMLLSAYSLGMAVPFFLMALFLERWQKNIRRILAHGRIISIISGIFLVIIGIMLYTNYFVRLSTLFPIY